jgi:hypothetical protein
MALRICLKCGKKLETDDTHFCKECLRKDREKAENEAGGLERGYWARQHKRKDGSSCGRVVAMYIQRKVEGKIKWTKIGEYCQTCGEVGLFNKFKEGLPREMRR